MTEEEKQAKRDELNGLISYYQGVYDDLEDEKRQIEANRKNIEEGVHTPLDEYDLSGEGDDWKGVNYEDAEDYKSAICSEMFSYDSDVGTVLSEIATALQKIADKIKALQDELAALG